jgi:CheY-like chemotaxis protein
MSEKKILVVDDEKDMLRLIEYNLNYHGYLVVTAQNGHEGLEKLRSEMPDLVLLDIKMPGLNGYEVCKIIKNEPSVRHIPVVFVSVAASEEDTQFCGAQAYITKPFAPKTLLNKVKNILEEV